MDKALSKNLRVISIILLRQQHRSPLFADLNTTSGTNHTLDVTVDGELTGSDGTDHDKTGTNTGVRATETELLGDLHETRDGTLTGKTGGLVDLGEHGIGGLGDGGGGKTGNKTGTKVDTGLGTVGKGVLVTNGLVDGLGDLLEDNELGHSVRNLLEQNGSESGVESADTLLLEDLGETAHETGSEGRLGDQTNTGGLKRAETDVSNELSGGRGSEVDSGAVVGGRLKTKDVDGLSLDELVTTELQSTLDEVTGGGRTETGEKGTSTLVLDDLAETTDHTTVVGGRVKLDTGLDDIEGSSSTVGDGAADSASESEASVKVNALGRVSGGSGHCKDVEGDGGG